MRLEAVAHRCCVKTVFLEISHNLQKNTCVRVSFLIKLQAWGKVGHFVITWIPLRNQREVGLAFWQGGLTNSVQIFLFKWNKLNIGMK